MGSAICVYTAPAIALTTAMRMPICKKKKGKKWVRGLYTCPLCRRKKSLKMVEKCANGDRLCEEGRTIFFGTEKTKPSEWRKEVHRLGGNEVFVLAGLIVSIPWSPVVPRLPSNSNGNRELTDDGDVMRIIFLLHSHALFGAVWITRRYCGRSSAVNLINYYHNFIILHSELFSYLYIIYFYTYYINFVITIINRLEVDKREAPN